MIKDFCKKENLKKIKNGQFSFSLVKSDPFLPARFPSARVNLITILTIFLLRNIILKHTYFLLDVYTYLS